MASDQDRRELERIVAGGTSIPIPPFPKLADFLTSVSPQQLEQIRRFDQAVEEWRKKTQGSL